MNFDETMKKIKSLMGKQKKKEKKYISSLKVQISPQKSGKIENKL